MAFKKADNGKPRMSLIPPHAELEIAEVLTHGGDKYGDENWKNCENWKRYEDALLRHVNAYRRGELADTDTGISHLAHAVCCCLFLMEHERQPKPDELQPMPIAPRLADGDYDPEERLPPQVCKDC